MPSRKKFDVFLSHNSRDKPWVIRLKGSLERLKVKVWLDKDEIRPGDLFAEALERGIAESKSVALIISPDSMSSGWVKAEYYRALSFATNGKLQLIPVLYKNAEIPGFLSDRNWVDFSNEREYEEKVEILVWGITGKKQGVNRGARGADIKLSRATGATQKDKINLFQKIENPFIRFLERKLRMENAHWIRAGMTVPAKNINFTAVYFQTQIEIFMNIRRDIDAACDMLVEDQINLVQDSFVDFMNGLLEQVTIRTQQIEDLLGPSNRQYDLWISLNKAVKAVHNDANVVGQSLSNAAMTLLSQPSQYERLSDDLRTDLTNLAVSIDEFQKLLDQTYCNAVKEKAFATLTNKS